MHHFTHWSVMMALVVAGTRQACIASAPVAPRNPAAHVLGSGRLQVEVMDPNAPDRYTRGVRFSPVANVLRATLDGNEFLFNPVAHDPLTESCGLANEFDLATPESPPGFQEAAIGGGFVKVGVGILRKSDAKYSFWARQELIRPAATTVTWGQDRADFEQACEGINGYAYRLTARVKVTGDKVLITFRLKNTGTKPFVTQHYNHNYFCFDGKPVGPGYTLEFPYDFKATGLQPEQSQCKRILFFRKTIPLAVNIDVKPPADYPGANMIMARHTGNGMSVRVETSVPSLRTAVHASQNYLCPEQFVVLKLKPGETREWTRSYEFQLPVK